MAVLKGEAYIEDVEKLNDGSSHLLLHLDGNNSQRINSKDPNKLKGKYKYRLKRISPLGNWVCTADPNQPNVQLDSHKEQQISQKSKKLVKSVLKNSLEKVSKSNSENSDNSDSQESTNFESKKKATKSSFSDKRNLFENASKTKPSEEINTKLKDLKKSSSVLSAKESDEMQPVEPQSPPKLSKKAKKKKAEEAKLAAEEASKEVNNSKDSEEKDSEKKLGDEGMFYGQPEKSSKKKKKSKEKLKADEIPTSEAPNSVSSMIEKLNKSGNKK